MQRFIHRKEPLDLYNLLRFIHMMFIQENRVLEPQIEKKVHGPRVFKRHFMYQLHIYRSISIIYGYIIDPHNDQLPVDLIAVSTVSTQLYQLT